MRTRSARALSVLLVVVLLGLPAPVGHADEDVVGHAIGHAGTALGMVRLLPGSIPESSALPELADEVSTSAFEGGLGLTSVRANSVAPLSYERAIAQAVPYGSAVTDQTHSGPGALVQSAFPDHSVPRTGPLDPTNTAIDGLVAAAEMTGSAQARWSETDGPCVSPIARSRTAVDTMALGKVVPTLPDVAVTDLQLPGAKMPKGYQLPAGLGALGGLLPEDGGALVAVSRELSARSTVEVVNYKDTERKAVEATSSVQAGRITLLPGTELELPLRVVKEPTLTAVSTGEEDTSKVTYSRPVLEARTGGETLFRLDGDNRSQDIPIGVPTADFAELDGADDLMGLPFVAGFAATDDGETHRLSEDALEEVVDLFVLRLSIGGLDQEEGAISTPFGGYHIGATARLLDVQLLPTEALKDALAADVDPPAGLPYDVPSSLAQLSLGEHVVWAVAPEGGVRCGPTAGAAVAVQPGHPENIAVSTTAGYTVPMLWVGALALLAGAVVLAIAPARRPSAPTPGPRPPAVRDGFEHLTRTWWILRRAE